MKDQKRHKKRRVARKHKTVIKGCDDFHCRFVGTELCISENCGECKLRNCRGCEHLEECFNEMMEMLNV